MAETTLHSPPNRIPYRRLRGRGYQGLVRPTLSRLYLGPDHLLLVEIEGYDEKYRRFYFRDVQMIAVRRDMRLLAVNLLLGVIWGLLSLALIGPALQGWFYPLGIASSLFILLILVNTLRGATCAAYISTAAGTKRLYALHRLPLARRCLQEIRPLIQRAQEDLAARIAPPPQATAADSPEGTARPEPVRVKIDTSEKVIAAAPLETPRIEEPLRHCTGIAHGFLFVVFLLSAVRSLAEFVFEGPVPTPFAVVLFFCILTGILWSLISQRRSDLDSRLKKIAWASFAYIAVLLSVGRAIVEFMAAERGPFGIVETRELTVHNCTPYAVLTAVKVAMSFTIGLSGMLLLWRSRKRRFAPPAEPGPEPQPEPQPADAQPPAPSAPSVSPETPEPPA